MGDDRDTLAIDFFAGVGEVLDRITARVVWPDPHEKAAVDELVGKLRAFGDQVKASFEPTDEQPPAPTDEYQLRQAGTD